MNARLQARLLCGAAVIGFLGATSAAQAAEAGFSIPAQSLASALSSFSEQSGRPVLYRPEIAAAKVSPGAAGAVEAEVALNQLLTGTGLTWKQDGDTFLIVKADQDPQSGSAAGDGADGTVEVLIVTAQKREEDIQDVPIAISAFTQEALERSQVAGGPDLMTQVPNMTFTKTNFASYSIQIRGIGTQAISATVDPAVAVAFNNTPFVRNRFFEQEFYDLQRVEVLRGPQGTLYGRNATAGVVNIISAKPKHTFEAKLSADVANYNSTRLEGVINLPLVEDMVAVRLAGAWTRRDGYSTNQLTGNPIDGRDLWSTRMTLSFEPTDRMSAILLWEHFNEDDDRMRSGKQVCKKDPGPSEIEGVPVPQEGGDTFSALSYISQGCLPASMYADESFQTPNGFALPFYGPTGNLGNGVVPGLDPYLSATQSRDLRVIESMVDPQYRAKSDVAQLQISFDLTDTLTLASETAYSADTLFSTQDYNRFNTRPGAFYHDAIGNLREQVSEDGVFCDPQIGCSDRLMLLDLSTANSRHFSQEFRLASNYDGPVNFSLGANFLRYDTEDKYYVFINSLTLFSTQQTNQRTPYIVGESNLVCQPQPWRLPDPKSVYGILGCTYIDPNPIGSLNDQGRNYFLSKNPYRLISYAAFGELYYAPTDRLKITAGLRWTVDKKHAPQVPSWLLASSVVGDYPVAEIVDQEWREPTGRLTVDWKPDVGFTDDTLLYASYAHGYKAGGANPPPPVIATYGGFADAVVSALQNNPKTFDAEFIDAFEIGSKNTLLDGRATLNLAAFYYDYEGYQISQIVNRSAVNLNFDAEIWGLEIEADWRPAENLRLGFKGGYQNTRLADGQGAIDTIDRTAGHTDWMIVKPFPTMPSNCILPTYVVSQGGLLNVRPGYYNSSFNGICVDAYYLMHDPLTGLDYVADPTVFNGTVTYDGYKGFDPRTAPNGGAGFTKDLSGNELPNAPHFTATITADYTLPLPSDWLMTLHTDLYYQSEAWTRVFNMPGYDKLKAYNNINVAAIFSNEDAGWTVMAYVKNVLDRDNITGAFLNSDDTGLTTNVFLTEPRLYGLRVTKAWSGGSPLGSFGQRLQGPGRLQVELGGGVGRFSADKARFAPAFSTNSDIAFPLSVQDHDLDLGDQREVRLNLAPRNGWRLTASYRFGRASGADRATNYDQLPGSIHTSPFFDDKYVEGPLNYGTVRSHGHEEYAITDFSIGKDVGIGRMGGGGESYLALGLRYASLDSTSDIGLGGEPDWYFPVVDEIKYPSEHYSEYEASLAIDRSFEGAGPVLSWEASKAFLGNDESGHIAVDWSASAGVLFGKQKVDAEGRRSRVYSYWPDEGIAAGTGMIAKTLYDTRISIERTRDVTVPTWGASLGLSYGIDRLKLSAGYRWERYVDAIDGGVEAAADFDRAIDEPYLKIRLGFGG